MLVAVLCERCRHVDGHRQSVGIAHHQHHLAPVEGASRHAPRHAHEERVCVRVLRLRLRRLLRRPGLHWRRRLPPPSATPSPPSAALAQLPRRAAAATTATTTTRVKRWRALGRRCRAAAEHLAVRPLPSPLCARAAPRPRPYEQRAGCGVEGGPPQLGHLWSHARHRSRRHPRPAGGACGAKAARRHRRRHRGAQVEAAAGVGTRCSASGRRTVEAQQARRLVGWQRAA